MTTIAIFDYGAGNLYSLKCSLERNGAKVSIVKTLENTKKFDGLILPGVGNFDPAIRSIEPFKKKFSGLIENKTPVLGICLGMEMLFNNSEEGELEGLKILDGVVSMLPKKKVKIPHMGWNNLEIIHKDSKILKGIRNESWVYFVHSYHIIPVNREIVIAKSKYGKDIPVVIEKDNIFGTQFHPEKSGTDGERIIKNFLNVCDYQK
ncbi:MAG: imidazole glycerol phosphate synthase subunit HisH [Nitrososphaeraceae archaeon]